MNKKQEANAFVRECLTTALVQLMQEQPFDGIAITDLVRRAGVSRVSFYRNFTSKKNVLEQHLMSLIREWGREFEDRGDPGYFSESLLRHCYLHRDFYLLLYRHGLSDLIYEAIRTAARLEEAKDGWTNGCGRECPKRRTRLSCSPLTSTPEAEREGKAREGQGKSKSKTRTRQGHVQNRRLCREISSGKRIAYSAADSHGLPFGVPNPMRAPSAAIPGPCP